MEKDLEILNKFCEYEDAVVLIDNALFEYQNAVEHLIQAYKEQQAEMKKKDKIISEMSNAMAKNYCCIANVVEEEICDKKCIGNNDWHCETCIKQYFERKVEDDIK